MLGLASSHKPPLIATTVVLIAVLLCVIPAAASAVDVRKGGPEIWSDLEVVAGDEDNNLTVTKDFFFGDKFWIEDTNASVTAVPGGGCHQESPRKVSCSGVTGTPASADFFIYAGGGNDVVSSPKHARIYGGEGDDVLKNPDESIFSCGWHDAVLYGEGGNDQLEGGCDDDRLDGGTGDDRLYGHGEHDTLRGGDGNDLLDASWGDDYMDGGTGVDDMIGWVGWDTVDYNSRSTPTSVSLDDTANDGGNGEDGAREDNVHADVESVATGSGRDVLVGSDWDNRLYGGTDTDHIYGHGGNDLIEAGDGNDSVYAGEGQDEVHGHGGDDLLAGGPGSDDVWGGDGTGDRINYVGRPNRIVANLDGARNDGEAGENDFIHDDVEGIEGGDGPDILTGDGGPNALKGAGGADELRGEDGDDHLQPNHSTNALADADPGDLVVGGGGTDTVEYPDSWRDELRRYVSLDDVANDGASGEGDNVTSSVENIKTWTRDDVLSGSDAANRLDGGGGNDVLDGNGGADTIIGGAGGADMARYVDRMARVLITPDDVPNDGQDANQDGVSEEGDDVRSDVENLTGGAGPDRIVGSDVAQSIYGGGGDDELLGKGGNDELEGQDGHDTLLGGAGSDGLSGGPGSDFADYSDHGFPVTVTLAGGLDDGSSGENDRIFDIENVRGTAWPDTLSGDARDNVLAGFGSGDKLNGLGGDDELFGESGADVIKDGAGADRISGGVDVDTIDYAGHVSGSTGVSVTLDGQANDGNSTIDQGADNVSSDVERVFGTAAADSLVGGDAAAGDDGKDQLFGHGGNDTLDARGGDDALDGGAGADAFGGGGGVDTVTYVSRTTPVTADIDSVADDGDASDGPVGARDNVGADVENLIGGSGNDVLTGGATANRLDGRAGNDTLSGDAGADRFSGGAGVDTVTYATRIAPVAVDPDGRPDDGDASDGPAGARDNVGSDVENLVGGSGNDSLTGSGLANQLDGRAGDDMLDGGVGPDVFLGGLGLDTVTYVSRTAGVVVDIDAVADDGDASDGPAGARDDVRGDVENLVGGRGDDTLTGNAFANALTGGLGADTLFGLDGADTLRANDGVNDTGNACGSGADVLVADAGDPGDPDCETVNRLGTLRP